MMRNHVDHHARAQARARMMDDTERKSTVTAYLLCIFLGAFGAHRFYLGRTGSAVGQLIFWLLGWVTVFITWIPLGIWILIDLIRIPDMIHDESVRRAYRLTE